MKGFLSMALVLGGSLFAEPLPPPLEAPPLQLSLRACLEEETAPDPLPATSRIDRIHDGIFLGVQHLLQKVDHWFADPNHTKERTPYSKFRLGMYTKAEDQGAFNVSVDPDFDIELQLPSLTRRLKLFATTEAIDQLHNSERLTEPEGLRIGIRDLITRHIELDAGAKVRVNTYLFSAVRVKDDWTWGETTWAPGLKGFYRSDKGYGANPYLVIHQYQQPWCFRTAGSFIWAEYTQGVEWEYSITLAHAKKLIDPSRYTNFNRARDLAEGSGLHFNMQGHLDDRKTLDAYRLQWLYKRPAFDSWGFLVVSPYLTWRNATDWNPEPGILIGVDMLFRETSTRK